MQNKKAKDKMRKDVVHSVRHYQYDFQSVVDEIALDLSVSLYYYHCVY